MQKILLEDKFKWNFFATKNIKIYIKGYFYNLEKRNYINYFNSINLNNIREKIDNLNGHFCFFVSSEKISYGATDKSGSIPLNISFKNNILLISSDNSTFKEVKNNELNMTSALSYSMSGFTIGSDTLYKDFTNLLPGEYFYLNNNKLIFDKYFEYIVDEINNDDESKLIEDLYFLTANIFSKTIKSVGNKQVVVPLSAGLDSRLVISFLKEMGCSNLLSYSYGLKNNFEYEAALSISQKLDVQHKNLTLNYHDERKYYESYNFKKFLSYSENICAFPHIQGISALEKLHFKKLINPNAIFINGNSGDYISGGHIPKSALNINYNMSSKQNFNLIFREYYNKHFSLQPFIKNKKNYETIKKKYNSLINSNYILKNETLYSLFENFELIDRQSKFTLQCQKTFEYMNYDWRLPLWDDEYLKFWKNVPIEFKNDQNLYKKMLKKYNIGGVWKNSVPVNNIKIRPKYFIFVRAIFKLIFGLIPIYGKKIWHNFEKIFIIYWIEPSAQFYSVKYSNFLLCFGNVRNHYTFLVKVRLALLKKNLMNDK